MGHRPTERKDHIMSNDESRNEDNGALAASAAKPDAKLAAPKPRRRMFGVLGTSVALGLLLVGAAGGALAMKFRDHDSRMALLPPVAINAMADDSLVAVKGKVAEQFGNKFIITDATGRALVDAGPAGNGKALVAANEEVTVQGRFDDGFVRAGMIIHADGKVDELRPPRPRGPHHGPFGPGEHGPGPQRGEGPAAGPEQGPRPL